MSEGRQLEIIVEENETGLRLDAYLAGKIPICPGAIFRDL